MNSFLQDIAMYIQNHNRLEGVGHFFLTINLISIENVFADIQTKFYDY